MKLITLLRSFIPVVTGLSALSAWAGPQADVDCAYHHTAGDDAIMMYGMPNHAMLHDFFGNTHTDAYSDYVRLRNQPDNTCNNNAPAPIRLSAARSRAVTLVTSRRCRCRMTGATGDAPPIKRSCRW